MPQEAAYTCFWTSPILNDNNTHSVCNLQNAVTFIVLANLYHNSVKLVELLGSFSLH